MWVTGTPSKHKPRVSQTHLVLAFRIPNRTAACMACQTWLHPIQHMSRWDTIIPGTCNVDLAVPAARSLVVAAPVISLAPPIPRFSGSSPYAPKSCVRTHILLWKLPQQLLRSLRQDALYISSCSSRPRMSMSCVHADIACPSHARWKWLAYIHHIAHSCNATGDAAGLSAEMAEASHAR